MNIVAIEVANQPKGAVLTITTAKKDDVKAIQEHLAAMAKGDCCKGMKDGSGCKHGQEPKADATKKCPHHEEKAAQPVS